MMSPRRFGTEGSGRGAPALPDAQITEGRSREGGAFLRACQVLGPAGAENQGFQWLRGKGEALVKEGKSLLRD